MASGPKAKVLFSPTLTRIDALVRRLQSHYEVTDSPELRAYSCYFPHCHAAFLMVDYLKDLSHWVREEEKNDKQLIFSLADFVYTNSDPFIVFLVPKVDAQCLWVCYEVQRRIELITEKTTLIWISTSWKQLSNYIISQVQDLDLDKLRSNFRDDTKRAESLYAEMQEKAKQLLKQEIDGVDTFPTDEAQHLEKKASHRILKPI